MPGIDEVAVAGVPDEELGERVGALIVGDASLDAERVKEYSRQSLARYKVPEIVVFVDELPYNRYGKIPRAAVVEVIRSRTGAGS
jgi:acyl-CoA synthetase (AMP-forming)/AMP-acid ligase II